MIKNRFYYTFLIVLFGSVCAPAFADAVTCQEAVEQKHFERLNTVCINLPHRDRLKKMRLMMSGDFSHHLGTVDKPTKAFVLLKQMADADDTKAQYMYSQLYGTVHTASQKTWHNHRANDGEISLIEYNQQIRAEAHRWLRKAAEGGHSLAMLQVAEGELLRSYTKKDIDLKQALQTATNAQTRNPVLAKDLIERIEKRIKEYY